MKKIQILGKGCQKCERLKENALNAAQELSIDCEIETITNINEITSFGVMTTPALAIDGKVKIVGNVPSKEELKKLIKDL